MASLLFVLTLLAAEDQAPAPDSAAERQRQQEVAALAPAKAKMLVLFVGDEQQPAKAALHPDPLLRWSNPTAGSVYGEVYLWTVDERPVAVASIYRWYHPYKDSTVEIVSLTEKAIEAREGSALLWNSTSSGLARKAVPDAPPPAQTRGTRVSQMRTIARRFAAELADKRGGEDVRRELRLLNQPVHRYESPKQGIVDGAMFALVEVTDPEAWLILEAVKKGEETRWEYTLARMNADAMEIRLDRALVASWPKVPEPWKNRKAPYTLFSFDPKLVPLEDKSKEAAP